MLPKDSNNMTKTLRLLHILTVCSLLAVQASVVRAQSPNAASPLKLWYMQPAHDAMTEAMPIGNGRLGALVCGGLADERVILDVDSLWTGDKNPSGDYGKMGSYQKLGEIDIDLPGHDPAAGYRRDLDISSATAHVSYAANGVDYRREYFVSYPSQVLVARFTADKPAAYSGVISLAGAHSEKTTADGNRLTFSGTLSNGIAYEAQLQVIVDGGTARAAGGQVTLDHCNGFTLILCGGTSYVPDFARNYLGAAPHRAVSHQVDAASKTSYAELRHEHVADYRSLFDRVKLSLGDSPANRRELPTDARKILAEQGDDPELEELLFQYGRYLMIACSRPGGLPANLQGMWCDSNNPPWDSDYHTDLNIEMNYWPVETTNLSECSRPLFDLVDTQIPSWRIQTQADPEYKLASGAQPTRGFDLRASTNITGGMGWLWIKTADAWLLESYWEHYAFTGDKHFLRTRAYPLLKEISEFWDDELRSTPDGNLVVPHGWSPEHGDMVDGTSFNQELVWDLFTNYIAASEALGVDPGYRERIKSLRSKLLLPKIGRWGQLQEWPTDIDDPNDHHRHTSHLIGVYPGHEFSVAQTPAMVKAARVSLLHRGNSGDAAEWSFAWRTALLARMHDGDGAYGQFAQFFAARNSWPNLFGNLSDVTPPIMQIDGDFGITAGVAEMLLQSQNGEIELLPALPSQWHSGSVEGLRARGGFEVSETWKKGALTSVTIHSVTGTVGRVRYGARVVNIDLNPGRSITLDGRLSRPSR